MPGLGTLVNMASGQVEINFHLEGQSEMVGFGQGARIGNFDEDGVRAEGNIFHLEKTKNDRCWARRPDWELW